jgi:hypothetical protein
MLKTHQLFSAYISVMSLVTTTSDEGNPLYQVLGISEALNVESVSAHEVLDISGAIKPKSELAPIQSEVKTAIQVKLTV